MVCGRAQALARPGSLACLPLEAVAQLQNGSAASSQASQGLDRWLCTRPQGSAGQLVAGMGGMLSCQPAERCPAWCGDLSGSVRAGLTVAGRPGQQVAVPMATPALAVRHALHLVSWPAGSVVSSARDSGFLGLSQVFGLEGCTWAGAAWGWGPDGVHGGNLCSSCPGASSELCAGDLTSSHEVINRISQLRRLRPSEVESGPPHVQI